MDLFNSNLLAVCAAIQAVLASEKGTDVSESPKSGGLRGKLNKVVLAYSGGLDTSVIVPWLRYIPRLYLKDQLLMNLYRVYHYITIILLGNAFLDTVRFVIFFSFFPSNGLVCTFICCHFSYCFYFSSFYHFSWQRELWL